MNDLQMAFINNPFGTVYAGSLILWVGSIIASSILGRAWCWIDDTTYRGPNVAFRFVTEKVFRLKDIDRYYDEEFAAAFYVCILVPFFLFITILSIFFWQVSMWFALAGFVAFVARTSRRVQKNLAKHIEDKGAHK